MRKIIVFLLLLMLVYYPVSVISDDSNSEDWPEEFWDYEPPELFEPDPDDLDGDGLPNLDEEYYNTDPLDPDSDNDGITDAHEIANGTDPNSPDTIGYEEVEDIIINIELESSTDDTIDNELIDEFDEADEIIFDDSDAYYDLPPDDTEVDFDSIPPSDYSNDELESPSLNDFPSNEMGEGGIDGGTMRTSSAAVDLMPVYMLLLLNDNDNDGIDDSWEIIHFGSTEACDPGEDPDQDNLSNLNEFKCYSDPNNPDSDADGLTDGFEFVNGMDPTSTDSDADLMPDYYEVTNGLNPIVDDSRGNLDDDGFTNYQEYILTTDPNNPGDTPAAPDDVGLGFDYDEQQGGGGLVGETIRIFNGNVLEYRSDLSFSSPNQTGLSLEAFYNSKSNYDGPMGYGWTHTYEVFLDDAVSLGSLTFLKITDSTGHPHYFYEEVTGEYGGVFAEKTFVKAEGGVYTWYLLDGSQYGFSSAGQLLWIDDPIGNRLQLTYNINDKLEKVTDIASGRELTFTYDVNGYLDYITGPVTTAVVDGKWIDYTITSQNLTSVTYADNSGFNYTYADANDIHNLTKKENKAGHLINTWGYNSSDMAISNYSREGKGVTLIEYQTSTQIDVTDAYDKIRSYYLTESSTRKRVESISEIGGRPGAFPWDTSNAIYWIYDNCMNPIKIEYAGGAVNLYENYDDRGNPGKVYLGWNENEQTALRTIEYTYHPELNTPLTRTEPSVLQSEGYKKTIWDYDDPEAPENDPTIIYNENPTNLPYTIIEKGFTKDQTGTVVSYEYITTLTYNTKGQVLSIDGPSPGTSDTTTIVYDPATGDALSITKPLIGATTYSGYDNAGQVGTVTDVNSQSKTYTYDSRGRVTDVTNNADSSVSSVTYNIAGLPELKTDEDGVDTTFEYESIYGRLFKRFDHEGNYIQYAYDSQGNVTEKGYYDPANERTNRKRYLYQDATHNMPGLLFREISGDDTYTQYGYDLEGNVASVVDPNGNTTSYSYDPLNRLDTVTQPGSINTIYGYDAHGNLISVTDAESHITTYQYDDMGRLVSTTSPDTGTVSYVYDEAGNPVRKTDQKGITVIYAYDYLNRLTDVNFPEYIIDENETLDPYSITFDYDSYDLQSPPPNGIGRRTKMTDPSGSIYFFYDSRGRLTGKSNVVQGTTYDLSRVYTPGGRVSQITYPSGRTVDYDRTSCACKVDSVTTTYNSITNILMENLEYRPFGGSKAMSTGGGGTVGSLYNDAGRMVVSNPGATHEKTYTYDNNGNLTSITAPSLPHNTRVFGYDALDRLDHAEGPWGTIDYIYDDVGNRLTKTVDGVPESYTYVPGSNKLDTVGGTIAYTYDDNGNITGIGSRDLIYNQNNRLVRVEEDSSILGEYTYNGLGQRIIKEVDGVMTIFHYDFDGNIIAESDDSGTFSKEYLYRSSNRLALVDYSFEANGEIYFFGNDKIGTPLILTDSTNTVVWEGVYKPFGEAEVNPNSTVANNFRLKGQYYDQETGFHYNYHRYYEPSTGRYLTPDPIGQEGGLNLYIYVENNPINETDPEGLQGSGLGSTPAPTDTKPVVEAFDPGPNPADPEPKNRDRRTSWLPPNLQNRPKYCPPYLKVSGVLLPNVKEKVISKSKCKIKVKCKYKGMIAKNWKIKDRKMDLEEMEYTIEIIKSKKNCCEE